MAAKGSPCWASAAACGALLALTGGARAQLTDCCTAGNGVCENGVCFCFVGFYGETCQYNQPACNTVLCNSRGECASISVTGQQPRTICRCAVECGWTGDSCDQCAVGVGCAPLCPVVPSLNTPIPGPGTPGGGGTNSPGSSSDDNVVLILALCFSVLPIGCISFIVWRKWKQLKQEERLEAEKQRRKSHAAKHKTEQAADAEGGDPQIVLQPTARQSITSDTKRPSMAPRPLSPDMPGRAGTNTSASEASEPNLLSPVAQHGRRRSSARKSVSLGPAEPGDHSEWFEQERRKSKGGGEAILGRRRSNWGDQGDKPLPPEVVSPKGERRKSSRRQSAMASAVLAADPDALAGGRRGSRRSFSGQAQPDLPSQVPRRSLTPNQGPRLAN